MITSLVPHNKRQVYRGNLRGMEGLNDAFDPTVPYTATQNFLDMQNDPSVGPRVNQIVSSGSVGNYSNYRVYNDTLTGKVFVDIGLSYPKLQELVPSVSPTQPPTQSDCPCNNCHEETVIETWYASKQQVNSSDIPVNMTSEVVVCEPTDGTNSPKPLCADDIARLSAQGINGLGNMLYTNRQKACINGCKGIQPESAWNKCMDGCSSTNAPIQSRTADSAWGKCTTACNGQGLSQEQLQRCYAACGTSTGGSTASNSGYMVSQSGQLVRSLSGLSNDNTASDPVVYDNPPVYYTNPTSTMDCEKGNSGVMAFALVGIAGLIIGGLIVKAIIKTR
ncbi:MAG: hypothetical protein IPM69_14865 [Ignavibacteria bacterium]|nr:hypothetical protein [Ignavibacteria bacterium]